MTTTKCDECKHREKIISALPCTSCLHNSNKLIDRFETAEPKVLTADDFIDGIKEGSSFQSSLEFMAGDIRDAAIFFERQGRMLRDQELKKHAKEYGYNWSGAIDNWPPL